MGLIERPAPHNVKEAFLKSLQLADDDDGEPGDGHGGRDNQLEAPIITLPLYVLGLRQLARGTVAGGAKQAGWQFLTVNVPTRDPVCGSMRATPPLLGSGPICGTEI